jgi:hypothetical protein
VEKSRFLFLEGSADAAVAPIAAAAAPPDASTTRADAFVVRAAPSTDCPAAGAEAPALDACSSAASAALGEGGAGSHLSRGILPLVTLFFLLRRRRVFRGHRRIESLLLT